MYARPVLYVTLRVGCDAQNTACECPWVVKDTDTKEMVLERTTLATLVLLVQSPPQ